MSNIKKYHLTTKRYPFELFRQKYGVTSFIEATDDFIRKHFHELIIQILSIHQNEPSFNISNYEKILSENIFTSYTTAYFL